MTDTPRADEAIAASTYDREVLEYCAREHD